MTNTSLKQQLKRLSLKPIKHSLTEIKTRPSFLYEPKDAAGISQDTIYYAAIAAFEDLMKRSNNSLNDVLSTNSILFNADTLQLNRLMLDQDQNRKFDSAIRSLLLRLSPFFTFTSCHIVLEWLILKFHINWYNVDDVMACIFPYHHHNYFVRMVQICDTSKWEWLDCVKTEGVPLSNSAIQRRIAEDQQFFLFVWDLAFDSAQAHKSFLGHNAICFLLKAVVCSTLQSKGSLQPWLLPLLVSRIKRGLESENIELEDASLIICAVTVRHHLLNNKLASRLLYALISKSMSVNRIKTAQVLVDSLNLSVLPLPCFKSICESANQFVFNTTPCISFIWCLLNSCIINSNDIKESELLAIFDYALSHCNPCTARKCLRRILKSQNLSDQENETCILVRMIDRLCSRFRQCISDELALMSKDVSDEMKSKYIMVSRRLFAIIYNMCDSDARRFLGLSDANPSVRLASLAQVQDDIISNKNVQYCIQVLFLRLKTERDSEVMNHVMDVFRNAYEFLSVQQRRELCDTLSIEQDIFPSQSTHNLKWRILNDTSLGFSTRAILLFHELTESRTTQWDEYRTNLTASDLGLTDRVNSATTLFDSLIQQLASVQGEGEEAIVTDLMAASPVFALLVLVKAATIRDPVDVTSVLKAADVVWSIHPARIDRKRRHLTSAFTLDLREAASKRDNSLLIYKCLRELISALPESANRQRQEIFIYLCKRSCHHYFQMLLLWFLKDMNKSGTTHVFISFCADKQSLIGSDRIACLRLLQLLRLGTSKGILDTNSLNDEIPILIIIALQQRITQIIAEVLKLLKQIVDGAESDYRGLVMTLTHRRMEVIERPDKIPRILSACIENEKNMSSRLLDICKDEPIIAFLFSGCKSTSMLRSLVDRIPTSVQNSPYILQIMLPHVKRGVRDPGLTKSTLYRLLIASLDMPCGLQLWNVFSKKMRLKLTPKLYRHFLTEAIKRATPLKSLSPAKLKQVFHRPSVKRVLMTNQNQLEFIKSFLELVHPLYCVPSATVISCDVLSIFIESRKLIGSQNCDDDESIAYVNKLIVSFANELVRRGTMDASLLLKLFFVVLESKDIASSSLDECLSVIAHCAIDLQQLTLKAIRHCVDSMPRPINLGTGLSKHLPALLRSHADDECVNLFKSLVDNALIGFVPNDELCKTLFIESDLCTQFGIDFLKSVPFCCFRYALKQNNATMTVCFHKMLLDVMYKRFKDYDILMLVNACIKTGSRSDVLNNVTHLTTNILLERASHEWTDADLEHAVVTSLALLRSLANSQSSIFPLIHALLRCLDDQSLINVVIQYCTELQTDISNEAINFIFDYLSSSGFESNEISLCLFECIASVISAHIESPPVKAVRFVNAAIANLIFKNQSNPAFLQVVRIYTKAIEQIFLDNTDVIKLLLAGIEQVIVTSKSIILPHLHECVSPILRRSHDFISNSALRDPYLHTLGKIVITLRGLLSPYVDDLLGLCTRYSEVTTALQQVIAQSIPLRSLIHSALSILGGCCDLERKIVCLILDQSVSLTSSEDVNLSFLQIRKLCMSILASVRDTLFAKENDTKLAEDASYSFIVAVVLKLSEETFSTFFTGIADWSLKEPFDVDKLNTFFRLCNRLSQRMRCLFTRYTGEVLDVIPVILNEMNSNPKLVRSICECLHSLLSHDNEKSSNCGDRFNRLHLCLLKLLVTKSADKTLVMDVVCPCLGQLLKAASSPDCTRQVILALRDGPSRSSRRSDRLGTIEAIRQIATCLRSDFRYSLPEIVPIVAEFLEDKSEDVIEQANCLVSDIENLVGESLQDSFVH